MTSERESALKAADNVFATHTGESAVPALVDLILRLERQAKIEALNAVLEMWRREGTVRTVISTEAEIARLEAERAKEKPNE